jgi:uncharacterized protein YkwD
MSVRLLLIVSSIGLITSIAILFYTYTNTSSEPVVLASETNISPSPTTTPTPTSSPSATPKPTVSHTSQSGPTPSELLAALNAYRQSQGKAALSSHNTLCAIAQNRANDQSRIGHLDHSGFNAAAQSQQTFKGLAEILQTNSNTKDATFLIQSGWAASASHNATMLDSQWTHGCGAMSGNFAAFIFAR